MLNTFLNVYTLSPVTVAKESFTTQQQKENDLETIRRESNYLSKWALKFIYILQINVQDLWNECIH